jgi:murein DD-endopeptidase MepM/ murein hydrolase activator NlpD
MGTPVLAAADGRVIRVAESAAGGRYVMMSHNEGRSTLYSHLQAQWCISGEHVRRGDVLGLSGSTGRATGPHLHFAVKDNGEWVDPMPYFGAADELVDAAEHPQLPGRAEPALVIQ